uniref:Major facilitator superfamily (MFS) profile domain-containing protein n=1 Tax=Ciona savignyi TaxID=51511 RepID=H2ZQX8_CIOSA
ILKKLQWMHYLSIFSACFENTFFSGAIYGWPALEYVLKNEGYFSDLCQNNTNLTSCEKSEYQFSSIFTISTSIMVILAPLNGYTFDKLGTWVHRSIASTLFTLGAILLAASSPKNSNLLYPGAIFIAIGGINFLISNVQLGNPAGSGRSTVMAFVNGSYDSAAILFLIVKLLYDSGVILRSILIVYAALTIYPWIITFTLMPRHSFPFPMTSLDYKYGIFELKDAFRQYLITKNEVVEINNELETTVQEDGKTLLQCIFSPIFWTNCFYFSLLHLRLIVFFGGSIQWLSGFNNSSEISNLTNVLGIMLCFGIFVAPLNGLLMDFVVSFNVGRGISAAKSRWRAVFASCLTTTLLAVIFSIAASQQNAYATFVLLLLARAFVYASNTAFLAFTFPSNHFGKLLGLTMMISGIVGLSSLGFLRLATLYDKKLIVTNYAMIAETAITVIHSVYIFTKCR